MKLIKLSLRGLRSCVAVPLLILIAALTAGCTTHGLAFVSNSDGVDHVYTMRWFEWMGPPSPVVGNYTSDPAHMDRYPDVSPDGTRVAYASKRAGDYAIVVRNLNDTSGASETVLAIGPIRKIRPRWSPNQDRIAYAEYSGAANQARIMSVSPGGGTPTAITNPGPGQSDSVGHDYFDDGSKIVFSRRNAATNSYDLFFISSDGSGTAQAVTASQNLNEVLPVVSHDQSLVAFVSYIQLGPGWPEVVTVLEAGTWIPQQSFQFQPPVGARRIGALAFSHKDGKLYIATRVEEVAAADDRDRYEIYAAELDGSESVRLTDNQFFDSHPSAIPDGAPTLLPDTSVQVVNNSGTLIHKVLVGAVEFTENLSFCATGCSTDFIDVPVGTNDIQLQQTSGGLLTNLGDLGPFENGYHYAVNIITVGALFCAELWNRTDTGNSFNDDTTKQPLGSNCP